MRWFLLLVVFLGCLSTTPQGKQPTPSHRAFIAALRSKTAQVYTYCAGELFARGSAVFLGDGFVATADLVIPPNCNIYVLGKRGLVKARDKAADIAIMHVNGLSTPSVTYGQHYLGQEVICVGWAYQVYTDYSAEQVTRGELIVEYPGSRPRFRVGCSFQKGSSGGPVFDNEGNLIGLSTSLLEPLPNVAVVDHFLVSPAYVIQRLHQEILNGEQN